MYRKSPSQLRNRTRATAAQFEPLEGRTYNSVHAVFLTGPGQLSVFGDNRSNSITVSRNAAGGLLVNAGAVRIVGGTPTVANTRQVQIAGFAGDDQVRLDESNGALPKATLFGGSGNDVLTGGSGADRLFGQAGNDFLFGQGGNDLLFGNDGTDALTGGAGNDQSLGGSGNDGLIWSPGDGTDLNEGGDGLDTVLVNGGNGNEVFTAVPNGTRVRFDRTGPAPFSLDIGTAETLFLRANAGDDTFTGSAGLAPLIHLTIDGGVGNDTLIGSDGADDLLGRDGNDFVDGNGGNDLVLLGDGDDTFQWDPGDGSDVIEGQNGNDRMVFNGSNLAERIDLSANGTRARLTRDVGNVTMDLNGLEGVDVNALGGADRVTVSDLSGTDLTSVNVNLQAAAGGGDGSADSVVVNGTDRSERIEVDNFLSVVGLHAVVSVATSEGASDGLTVNALGGDDTLIASSLVAGRVKLTEDGGSGNDTVVGSRGDDTLLGGDGNDDFIGFRGNDTAFMGAGNDSFEWLPGDGSDTVEGQGGRDTLVFEGANVDENIDLSANGNRVRLVRDVAGVTMDLSGVEATDINAFGGADKITVNDLSATDLTALNVNLASALGDNTGDGASDSVIVNGTNGDDNVQVAAFDNNRRIAVGGLFPFVNITGAEGANDKLTINTLGGADAVDAGSLPAGLIGLTIVGGAGNDTLVGGAGDDTFVWNPGDGSDTIEGGTGEDEMLFNGSNGGERIDLTANGNRLRLLRNVGPVTMDVDGVERVNVITLGGQDTVTVNDLSATDVSEVNVNLGAGGTPTGDLLADSVVVNGTDGAERISLFGGAVTSVTGLRAAIRVTGADGGTDVLTVNGRAGDDTIDASPLPAGAIAIALNGDDGNDVLNGGAGNDILNGGPGDDTLSGGPGDDTLSGGPGNNLLTQD